jgi:hypothetical protein
MVVPVFITNCHVSENPKNGPVMSQMNIADKAIMNAAVEPLKAIAFCANLSKR